MGLVFQSRAFIQLKASDDPAKSKELRFWDFTGRNRSFLHSCQEGKGASFGAAKHVLEELDSLTHSFGFFSLTGDYLDCPDRDRAYILGGAQFREVNTRNVLSREATPG